VAFLISIYIFLPWDYQTCGLSYFYLHMSPLGLLDLWHFLFLFTYISPGITRPVVFLISIYICLPWDYQTCGISFFYLHVSPGITRPVAFLISIYQSALGLLDLWRFLFLFTYVSPGITRPVAFLISIYICLPWD
jgi:hypothetical protein